MASTLILYDQKITKLIMKLFEPLSLKKGYVNILIVTRSIRHNRSNERLFKL